MTNNHTEQQRGRHFTSAYNVISVSFDPDSNAYAALTALKELESQDQLGVEAAAVVARGDDGAIVVKDRVDSPEFAGAASGGILGLLIGILGGPLGVLIGGTYGLLLGSLVDLDEVEETDSVLSQISASVRPGQTALLAQVTEQSPEVVDAAMAGLGGTRAPPTGGRRGGRDRGRREGPARGEARGGQGAAPRPARARPAAGPRHGRAAQGEGAAPREGRRRLLAGRESEPTPVTRVSPLSNSDVSAAGSAPADVRPRAASLSETRDTVARAVEVSISPRTILLVAGTVAVAWALASIASVLLGLPGLPK